MSSVSALVTWGDGPDILICGAKENVSGFGISVHESGDFSFGLTKEEAINLATQLLNCYSKVLDIEEDLIKTEREGK